MAQGRANLKIKLEFSLKDVISALEKLEPEEKELFIENLLAATSPEYLGSINEAREDYRAGRVSTHEEVFGTTA